MRLLGLVLACLLLLGGCARKRAAATQWPGGSVGAVGPDGKSEKAVITPETALVGKVARANVTARFVVLNFPLGRLPAMEQRLQVYRRGLKIGELKVTGPQLDDAIVADITAGEAQPGDEVRDQ